VRERRACGILVAMLGRLVSVAVVGGWIAAAGCGDRRIPPGGPRAGASGFERVTLHNHSELAICSITGCFLSAYRVGPSPHVQVSHEQPVAPGERALLDVPSCGDVLQATACDGSGNFLVSRGEDGALHVGEPR
jgi:hypothetical protein